MQHDTQQVCGRLGLVVAVAVAIAGCGPANPRDRLPVSGRVTLDGAPLDQGVIQFSPLVPDNTVGSGARIERGKYEIPTHKGLPVGKYRVRINSAEADDSPLPPDPDTLFMTDRPTIERIPAKYSRRGEEVVEVSAGGRNRFDYDILTDDTPNGARLGR